MGCDIHCYIEYSNKSYEDKIFWSGFGGRINPGRNYALFGILAGVRGSIEPRVPLRGRPDDMGYDASGDAWVYVVTDEEISDEYWMGRSKAERYVENGYCEWRDESHKFVSNPDWHSYGWLTTAEWRDCVQDDRLQWPAQVEYFAMCGAMDELERRGYPARVVFWFDN